MTVSRSVSLTFFGYSFTCQDLERDCGSDEPAGGATVPASGRLPLHPVGSEDAGRRTSCSRPPHLRGSVCSRNGIGQLVNREHGTDTYVSAFCGTCCRYLPPICIFLFYEGYRTISAVFWIRFRIPSDTKLFSQVGSGSGISLAAVPF